MNFKIDLKTFKKKTFLKLSKLSNPKLFAQNPCKKRGCLIMEKYGI